MGEELTGRGVFDTRYASASLRKGGAPIKSDKGVPEGFVSYAVMGTRGFGVQEVNLEIKRALGEPLGKLAQQPDRQGDVTIDGVTFAAAILGPRRRMYIAKDQIEAITVVVDARTEAHGGQGHWAERQSRADAPRGRG